MAGNVWEWTGSIFAAYPYKADDGREGNGDSSNLRVLRGGSWDEDASFLPSAGRFKSLPDDLALGYGFRCARS